MESCLWPRRECSGMISTHCNLHLLDSSNSSASASWVAEITGDYHHAWLILVFLVETGFHHVGQAGLLTRDLRWSTCLSLSKCWDYRPEPLHLAFTLFFFSWNYFQFFKFHFRHYQLRGDFSAYTGCNEFIFFLCFHSICFPLLSELITLSYHALNYIYYSYI